MKTFEQIMNDLRKQIYAPVYFLCGEEPYFIDVITNYIQDNVLNDSEKEFNLTVRYGRETDIQTVIGDARRYPMMSNYQVVIVKEAQNWRDLDGLMPYVQQPQPTTLLVINYKYKKADRRLKLFKLIEKSGVLFESKPVYDDKLPEWISGYVKAQNRLITPKAAFLMAENLGADLSRVVNEVEKLLLVVPEGGTIDENLIETHIGISKEFNVFELQNALNEKNGEKAHRIAAYFAANPKDNPLVKVVSILYPQFIRVLHYHRIPDKRDKNLVARKLGINPFFINGVKMAARNYSSAQLERVIGLLREYDLKSKGVGSARVSDGSLIREMVSKILNT
ncbi:MAG: DNA polymerase III subunit delta [Bacteroidales bacterium]